MISEPLQNIAKHGPRAKLTFPDPAQALQNLVKHGPHAKLTFTDPVQALQNPVKYGARANSNSPATRGGSPATCGGAPEALQNPSTKLAATNLLLSRERRFSRVTSARTADGAGPRRTAPCDCPNCLVKTESRAKRPLHVSTTLAATKQSSLRRICFFLASLGFHESLRHGRRRTAPDGAGPRIAAAQKRL